MRATKTPQSSVSQRKNLSVYFLSSRTRSSAVSVADRSKRSEWRRFSAMITNNVH